MKHPNIIYLLLLIMVLTDSCHHNPSPVPLKFKAYENNPILGPGKPGEWDEISAVAPFALKDGHVFYLFYSGFYKNGKVGIGMATSGDGYHYTKYPGNPVFTPGAKGFDSYSVGSSIILKDDTAWVMYYNGGDIAMYSPAPNIGRATAKTLTGPWIRIETPVLTRGKKGEWDGGFIVPSSIIKLEDSTYRLYYSAGAEFSSFKDFFIGMATSKDGMKWVKYNDPSTKEHPFADSDPVLMTRKDKNCPWSGRVIKISGGFEMYYTEYVDLAYATSRDGIHWRKYPENPVYQTSDDPFSTNRADDITLEFPNLIITDSICFMYYDYGTVVGRIGMATAAVKLAVDSNK